MRKKKPSKYSVTNNVWFFLRPGIEKGIAVVSMATLVQQTQ